MYWYFSISIFSFFPSSLFLPSFAFSFFPCCSSYYLEPFFCCKGHYLINHNMIIIVRHRYTFHKYFLCSALVKTKKKKCVISTSRCSNRGSKRENERRISFDCGKNASLVKQTRERIRLLYHRGWKWRNLRFDWFIFITTIINTLEHELSTSVDVMFMTII